MGGILTKSEKILILCTAVFLLVLGGACFWELSVLADGDWSVETHRTVEPEAWFPEEAQRININTASVEQLKELPGIGDALAKRIVEYREEHGFFDSIARLLEVKGIGAKTFQGIQDLITVEEAAT